MLESVGFIGGAGHSGSTLLGLVLGAHPCVFYAGEANKSLGLGDPAVKLRKRTCKVCGEGCVVWSKVRAGQDDLHEALAEITTRPIVIDSTKSLAWLEAQSARLSAKKVALVLFFLGRDGRAVLASSLRKRPETSARAHAAAWVDQIAATEAFAARFPGTVVRVRYELLATRTDETIAGCCAALGIAPSDAMRAPWASEQHPLGGNAGTQSLLEGARTRVGAEHGISGDKRAYYEQHPRSIVLDQRWRRELSAEALAEFEAVAGETNRAYAWDASEGSA
jgi:hypothetical protein